MDNEKQLIGLKKQKLQKIYDLSLDPYPEKSKRNYYINQLFANKQELLNKNLNIVISGRLRALRRQGKIGFGNLQDSSGKIQIYANREIMGLENYEIFKLCDLGDIVQVSGLMFFTNSGEYTFKIEKISILCKTIRPLPTVKEKVVGDKIERYDIFSDKELRYRKRYLDLILNPQNLEIFAKRSKIISCFRDILDKKGFLEVETPILQPLYGGANAKPFTTRYNKLDQKFFLRIATELYLKRLIIGGYDKVYEIGKNFRNEGMDKNHNPEFTVIELYQAFSDLDGMIELTQNLISETALVINGTYKTNFSNMEISLEKPFKRETMLNLIEQFTGEDFSDFNFEKIAAYCKTNDIEITKDCGPGALIGKIFDAKVEDKLIQPTFVLDYPVEISPLAKRKSSNKNLVYRFELFIGGSEFANAFSELNDPIEQKKRMKMQVKKRKLGDEEANEMDKDFLEALEYGMPPTGGLGIGLDRVVMLLTGKSSIKDVIFFPQMRTLKKQNNESKSNKKS